MVNLFVGGFPLDIQEIELAKLFCRYGDVNTIKIVRNRATKVCKGYGFIEMKNDVDAQMAIEALDGMEMGDRQLSVRVADVKPAKPAFKPRPYTPGGQAPRYGNRPEGRPYNKPGYGNADRGERPNYGNSDRPSRPDYRNNDRADRPGYGNSDRPARPDYRNNDRGDRTSYGNSDRSERPNYGNSDRSDRPNYGNSDRPNYRSSDRPDYRNNDRGDRPDYRQSDRSDYRPNDPERKKRPRRGDV